MPARKNRTGAALREWEQKKALRELRAEELKAEMRARYDFALLSPKEASAILDTTTKQLRELEHANDFIPRYRIGIGRFGYKQSDLIEWMKRRAVKKGA